MPNPSIKDEQTYRAVRREGASEGKAARIANASAAQGRAKVASKGGTSRSYDDWTKRDLVERAREIGISGRSTMSKSELVDALRNS